MWLQDFPENLWIKWLIPSGKTMHRCLKALSTISGKLLETQFDFLRDRVEEVVGGKNGSGTSRHRPLQTWGANSFESNRQMGTTGGLCKRWHPTKSTFQIISHNLKLDHFFLAKQFPFFTSQPSFPCRPLHLQSALHGPHFTTRTPRTWFFLNHPRDLLLHTCSSESPLRTYIKELHHPWSLFVSLLIYFVSQRHWWLFGITHVMKV